MEQKQRLRHCGLRNVVMVVEGTTNADRSLEQAMVSTGIESDFLVHRTANLQGTAKFLQHLTKRLEERCAKEKVNLFVFSEFIEIASFRLADPPLMLSKRNAKSRMRSRLRTVGSGN